MKKKMSLSDYLGGLKKRKKDEAALAQAQATQPSKDSSDTGNAVDVEEVQKANEEVLEDVDMPLAPLASDAPANESVEETKIETTVSS